MSQYADSIDSTFRDDPNSSWYKVFKYIKPSSSVLDFGCSSGNFGKALIQKKNCVVDGVELDKHDAQKAARVLSRVYTNNIEVEGDGFLGGNTYDTIYFGDVIEHLVHPVEVLKLMKSHLKNDGRIAFSVPNMAHMSVRLMLLKGEFRYGDMGLLDKTHLHFYDQDEIKRVVQEAGYEFEIFDYVKRDIPREVLAAELSRIGLAPSQSFLDKTKSVSSSAYQFVGIIRPSLKQAPIAKRPKLSPPINEMERHIDYINTVHKAQIDAHKLRIAELEEENRELRQRHQWVKKPIRYIRQRIGRLSTSDR